MSDQSQEPTPPEGTSDRGPDPVPGEPVSFSDASPDAAAQAETLPTDATGPSPADTPGDAPDPVAAPATGPTMATDPASQPAAGAPAAEATDAAQARGPMAQAPSEPGWWQASDGWWYPPESAPPSGAYPATTATSYPPGYPPAGGQPKSRVAAGVLGILLGGFGVHRFYLGYTNIGIIQILVTIFTCGLGSIWGFVEGILILVKNENFLTDANGVPLAD